MARPRLANPWKGKKAAKDQATTIHHHRPRGDAGPHLEDLANEILIQIIQFIDTEVHHHDSLGHARGSAAVLNLALCSSHFHRLAEPVLYTHVDIRDDALYNTLPDLVFFLCRILDRPDLARRVRFLYGAASGSPVADESMDMSGLRETDRTLIRTAVRAASDSERTAQQWMEAIEWGTWDAIMALLLSVVPNIEELQLERWSNTNEVYPFIIRFFERAANLQETALLASPFSLRSLRRISLSYWDTEGGFSFENTLRFLRLKSVTAFHGNMVSEDLRGASTPPPYIAHPSTFTARELKLTSSVLHHESMIPIFRSFPALERLHYEFGGACVGYADFEPPRMMAALEHLKHCLKEITILCSDGCVSTELDAYPIGSFASFEKLTSIDILATGMLGDEHEGTCDGFPGSQELVDAVPPSLESLSLRDCNGVSAPCLVSQVSQLVLQKATRTPALKFLNLGWEGIVYPDKPRTPGPVIHPPFTREEAEQLMVECEKAEIELKVKYVPPELKWVSYTKEPEKGKMPYRVTHTYYYPYEGYEKCCEENGLDPETGRRPREWV
ncbi:hypothetical protein MMC30_003687 [Trapelia coarctata]|nr:hypothetical protein [Trapelia coarctata]